MEIKGIIKDITPVFNGTSSRGNSFQRLDVVVEEYGVQYPNSMAITAMNERISELTDIKKGMYVSVIYNIKAREYKGSYYNNLSLFKITPLAQPQQQMPQMQVNPYQQTQPFHSQPFNPQLPADNPPY